MKIWIRNNALRKDRENLLWPGALFGLNYLRKLGHATGFGLDKLTGLQRKLLENEKLNPDFDDSGNAEFFVFSEDGNTLVAGTKVDLLTTAPDWVELSHKICFPERKTQIHRKTAETDIQISVNLDGTGKSNINTGLGFLDHMLEQIARHGLIDLNVSCKGDLEVDEHHTIEDVAITLGKTICKALGNKTGIQRYSFVLPMDESKAEISLDLSGRPYLVFAADFNREKVGELPTEMIEHFFYSLALNMKATLHIEVEGTNDHHKIEACFKGFARCLRAAISRNERQLNILPSTKEKL